MTPTDDELLAILADERRSAIGFDEDAELTAARTRALEYYHGVMNDMPAEENRSKACSSDVWDAVETALPDLIEIFTGGDDVLAFAPTGPEDEKAAEQETDYVRHVVFHENDGFLVLYTAIKDALLTKLGVVKWWWDEAAGERAERFTGKGAVDVALAEQGGALVRDIVVSGAVGEGGEPLVDFTAVRPGGRLCIEAVPPEDFAAARDARLSLKDATYCAIRSRPRAQDLIAQGVDPALVARLPAYGARSDGAVSQARDTVAEQVQGRGEGVGDLRQVEVVEHFIRLPEEDGRIGLIRVLTGGDESVLLHRESANRIPYAVITPYIAPHRLYGLSVADKLVEVQRIKTALMRMLLDSGYFALNQRHLVVEAKANEFTLSDLMRNEPMVPVRARAEGAVTPLGGGGLNFDVAGALEYFSTVAEQRTGVVRNAQGLNPDTLHRTAAGALALIGAAQKRLRLMARVFAETGLKDLYLGVHAALRENATQGATVRLRGGWIPIDPTAWGERADMTVQVGLGAAGREHDIAALEQALPMLQNVIELQGGLGGPLVNAQNAYAFLLRALEKLGFKDAERYVSDPTLAAPAAPPPPHPDQVRAQADVQARAAEIQLNQARAGADVATERMKAVHRLAIAREKLQAETELKREQAAAEIGLKRQELAAEAALKRELAAAGDRDQTPGLGPVGLGGEPG
ncbi:MAG TPA: hypothetical protein VG939_05810 [Caulobacteraceae bacterium]|nr:hypothetical protein [Caulobacteraceae bacterium]